MNIKRGLGQALLYGAAALAGWALAGLFRPPAPEPDPLAPTPALGRAIATALHQVLTDAYFAPLERLSAYMLEHPDRGEVNIDQMAKWAPDDDLPTCFVWWTDGSRLATDHPVDPDAMQIVLDNLRSTLGEGLRPGQLFIRTFKAHGERHWLGFLPVPMTNLMPYQFAGCFFSIDRYLEKDVPRLIDGFIDRPRFPLAEFESDHPGVRPDGHVALRILNGDDEVFLERGRTFTPEQLLYSESKSNPGPVIVALQRNWDLEIYSSRYRQTTPAPSPIPAYAALMLAMVMAITGFLLLRTVSRVGT